MPNIKSAKKRLRQSLELRDKNRSVKSSLKTQCKKVIKAVADKNAEKADAELKTAAKLLDRAASHNVIHANAAARTKSRLSSKIKVLKGKA